MEPHHLKPDAGIHDDNIILRTPACHLRVINTSTRTEQSTYQQHLSHPKVALNVSDQPGRKY